MINLSINSACNNNCDYCFQKDSYHLLNKEMSLEEVVNFLDNWCVGAARVGIMGGEPTLHSQCVEISKEIAKRYRMAIFSNLLCDLEILKELVYLPNVNWLINTTTKKELMPIFKRNIDYIKNNDHIPFMTFGITLTGDIEFDSVYIENLIKIGKDYPEIVKNYRVSLAVPCHDKKFKLKKYDESVLMLYNEGEKYTPNLKFAFDCSTTPCQLSSEIITKVVNDPRTMFISATCNCASMCVAVDGKIVNCFSTPEELFDGKTYHDFENWRECYKYISQVKTNFMQKYEKFCKTCAKCNDVNCQGVCFSCMAHLVCQEEKKNKFHRELTKIKYKFINRNM